MALWGLETPKDQKSIFFVGSPYWDQIHRYHPIELTSSNCISEKVNQWRHLKGKVQKDYKRFKLPEQFRIIEIRPMLSNMVATSYYVPFKHMKRS